MHTDNTPARLPAAVAKGRKAMTVFGLTAALALTAGGLSPAGAQDRDPWPDLRVEFFKDRPVVEDGTIVLEAPVRAEDAALVPITVRFAPIGGVKPRAVTMIVDQNPAPLVATFTLGEGFGDAMLSTRVRINAYSNVRAIVETSDGVLHMATKFVKASGGCSAPALKDQDAAMAELGKMQFRAFEPTSPDSRDALIMVRHPNHSGMQMDQLTGYYIPARVIDSLEVRRGETLVFRMEGGISLSENPNIRFTLAPGAPDERLTVKATDSEGGTFDGVWPLRSGGS
jgi:sulfur-oxidizing protein SoxY